MTPPERGHRPCIETPIYEIIVSVKDNTAFHLKQSHEHLFIFSSQNQFFSVTPD